MNGYISREAVITALCHVCSRSGVCLPGDSCVAYEKIKSLPEADVRPVVLCKNCKHNMANIVDIQDGININEGWNACQLTELYDDVEPEDFCSRGVEMEDDE